MIPPKPPAAPKGGGVLRLARAFRRDLLSALPAHLYHARMAEFRSPLIHSFFCNDPALVRLVLSERPGDFPKSNRLREGLAPLLGRSVFVTNGAEWEFQRRIIDPAFAGGRLHLIFPAMRAAAEAALTRLPQGEQDIEPECSHAAADIIFRTLFSLPIEHETANRVFHAFRAHQDAQPVVNPAALIPWPRWLPRLHARQTRRTAMEIRGLISDMVNRRMQAIQNGTAPDDLATRIMTTPDPETGRRFTTAEMTDQVAIFFLAGHETSAAALAWSLWLLAANPEWQARVSAEADAAGPLTSFADLSALRLTRNTFREAMRLYPPVPMMVRQVTKPETLRDRPAKPGAQIVLSPWHLHRHDRIWPDPDSFDPERWDRPDNRHAARSAYIPFSVGPRVCPGAGFAMAEGVLMLALITRQFHLSPGAQAPIPQARLTTRGQNGIRITLKRRTP
ncbi:MAG: cytochrome P450 [Paracoccus sp. (in: a-proteobacteria)]|uniref:cytochrome P450 n=1 Tax=Paracoccus sp. TaxID=267 RepID=UPI0026E10A29|nr:cytochrome P450 [Paracoccus sp. (in: a-proteobacteria)]MDO5631386.1 cytochrome P450 [Paracoccus sp. (in: a-proteobacteria)]